MGDWDSFPLTRRALWKSRQVQGPSGLELEWARALRREQDVVFLSAGAYLRRGASASQTWTALFWHVHDESDADSSPPPATRVPPDDVERVISPLAHAARIRIMQTLFESPRAPGDLSQMTGLKGGSLYYHLRELLHAAYVRERDGLYDITPFGCQMLITLASIANVVIRDRGEDGLMQSAEA